MRPRSACWPITGVATTWHVYLLALLFGIGTAFDNPARQSFVSELAGPEHLPNAIGLNSATFHAARIVGPALAGLVIAGVRLRLGDPDQRGDAISAFIAALLLIDAAPAPTVAGPRPGPSDRSARGWPTSAGTTRSCWCSAWRSSSAPSG